MHFQLLPKQIIPDLDNLRLLATKKGTDGWVAAVDYFITTRDGFPWASVPKVVVGRVGYDNWMVSINWVIKWVCMYVCVRSNDFMSYDI